MICKGAELEHQFCTHWAALTEPNQQGWICFFIKL